ncbi:MAG: hypothetical protein PHT40_04530 [Patescibacteria group bacterium]|nr:hypothetical protein [Patescibacteria group bacterium]
MRKKPRASAGNTSSRRVSPLSSRDPVEYKIARGKSYFNVENLRLLKKKYICDFFYFLATPSKNLIAQRPKVPPCVWHEAELSEFKVGETYPVRIGGKRSYLMTVLGLNAIQDERFDSTYTVLRGKVANRVELFLQCDYCEGSLASGIEIGTVPDDPTYWTVAKPETADSRPINLKGYKFFHVKDTGFEPAKNYFQRVFVATKNPDDMRAQIVRVTGGCNRATTDTRNLLVNSEYKPVFGDPWSFAGMGTYRGVYSFQEVKVAIFQAGANYLAIPTCGDGISIRALVKHTTSILLAQIKIKRNAIKKLDEEIDRLLAQIN